MFSCVSLITLGNLALPHTINYGVSMVHVQGVESDCRAIGSRLALIGAVQRLAVEEPYHDKSSRNIVNVHNLCAQCRNRSTI